MRKIPVLFCLASCFAFLAIAVPATDHSLAELYKTGTIRFVPEITITDKAMAGKDFFSLLLDLAIDDKGCLYVTDYQADNIKKFDAQGKFIKTIGKAGQGPGDFNGPGSIEFSKGRLYVLEGMNLRISILNADGSFIKSTATPFDKGYWLEMKALPDGRLVIQKEFTDRNNLDASQEFSLELFTADLEYIKTIYQRQVRRNKYIREPRFTKNIPIPYASSVYWDVNPDGKIIIGYSEKFDIEIYDPDKGKIKSFSHPFTPVEVTAADKKRYFDGISVTTTTDTGTRTVKQGAPDYIVNNAEFPRFFPPFRSLKTDVQGNIWIIPWTSASQASVPCFLAFQPDGKFINLVKLEDQGFIPYGTAWLPDGFWTMRSSKDGEHEIVKYKIAGK
jgi:hypothetical protein